MTIGELKELIKDLPDEMEIRVGAMYEEVCYTGVHNITEIHPTGDMPIICFLISDEIEY